MMIRTQIQLTEEQSDDRGGPAHNRAFAIQFVYGPLSYKLPNAHII